ncbi:fructosamine kinase family protein [Gracilibacillus oryzae]|uniref:Fructosamine kinase family protein n=1 Tax=Gracilibacillus oryzae TaxID=1672701 RepID=A0A7C8KRZ6_9BACI|nr:fructosamine kinase family protein [Gracilibacillus oryzae]KAB8127141.1 fructosamine kinase family protein [Gracilibacillus oryzae]
MQARLKQIGDNTDIKEITSISGGDINKAFYVKTEIREYFVKKNINVPADFFKIEADGLERLRATETIRVPEVYHVDIASGNEEIYLIMEWVGGEKSTATGKILGEKLAELHLSETDGLYGMSGTTFVGEITQENDWDDDWLYYYREKRLGAQLELGTRNGTIRGERRKQLEKLLMKLENYIPKNPRVSLLHGDLWGGNWITGPGGEPYLIDPSVVYGDHLFEIAFTELFGGFPADFYQSYQDSFPLADYYEEVKPLYQLFYLLVHLNLFGEGYGGSVDRIVGRYV